MSADSKAERAQRLANIAVTRRNQDTTRREAKRADNRTTVVVDWRQHVAYSTNANLFHDTLESLREKAAGGTPAASKMHIDEYMAQRQADRTKLGLRPLYQRPAALRGPEGADGPEEQGGVPVLT
jgi:hypothetical protein